MIHAKLLSAIAASAILLSAGSLSAQAADYDGNYPAQSRYSNDFADDPTDNDARPAIRRDRDDGDGPRYGWRRHGDRGYGQGRYMERIEAKSSYRSDYGPAAEREARARFSAIEAWKSKVSNIYGRRFAHWRNAAGKQVDCDAYRGAYVCTASARPVPGWSRWSWYGQ